MIKILLVDDQAHILRVVKLSLDRSGFEVDTALSGEDALRLLRANRYDVLIADQDMPQLSGCQLCEVVQRDFADRLPLCFVASDEISSDLEHWSAAYPEIEFLTKPMSLRWLTARLEEFFGAFAEVSAG